MYKLSEILNNSYSNNIFTLMRGVAGAQAVHLASIPLLTRIYGKEEFGILSLFLVAASLFSVLISGSFNHAIIAVNTEEKARDTLHLQVVFSTIVSSALTLLVLILHSYLESFFKISYWVLFCAIIFSILNSLYFALYAWCIRTKNFKTIARNKIWGTIANYSFAIGFSFISLKWYGLVIGYILGQTVFFAGLLLSLKINIIPNRKFLFSKLKDTLKLNWKFPTFLVPSTFIGRFAEQFHFIVISRIFSVSAIAPLEIYRKAIGMPLSLIGTSVGDVFKQRASKELQSKGHCLKTFLQTTLLLASLSILPTGLLALWGKEMFSFVFGSEWEIAGHYAQILSPVFFFAFTVSPLSALFLIGDKQLYGLITNIITIILSATGMLIAYNFSKSITYVLYGFSISYCIKYLVQYLFCWLVAKGPNMKHFNELEQVDA